MMLSPYRVLDLCGELGCLTGKILAELGADVVKVEPPGGDPFRKTGPFFKDEPHPEHSLSWIAYNSSKRGVTVDITSQEGRPLLLRAVEKADFLLESYPPGFLEKLGLGYERLREINPGLILVSITPFGQDGPYAAYRAGDLEVMALSGAMSLAGEPDGPPLRVTHPQAASWAGAEAAMAALIALFHRHASGRGQHVDVSAQCAAMSILAHAPVFWDMLQTNLSRAGAFMPGRNVHGAKMRVFWPVKDGWVNFIIYGGPAGLKTNRGLVDWMESRGGAPEPLKNMDWQAFDVTQATQQEIDGIEGHIGEFLRGVSKAEFLAGVTQREMLGYPVSTMEDIYRDPQLIARNYWQEVHHEGLGRALRMPGAFAKFSAGETGVRFPAPRVGQHNAEFWSGEPGVEWGEPERLGGEGAIQTAGEPEATPQALAGLKIVEFGAYAAGPYIGKFFANFGARVVHVESRERPDGFRLQYPPFKDNTPGLNRSGCFAIHNDSKHAVTLNLKHPAAHAAALRLVGWADVIIENMRPGVLPKLGLDYESLRAANPGLVLISSCNMGQDGPRANHPGFGSQLSALSGFSHLTGFPEESPQLLYGPYIDFIAAAYGAVAVLAALDQRRRTGEGQAIDLSQYETGLHFIAPALLDYDINGRIAIRDGNRDPQAAPHGAFPCRGGTFCALSCWSEAEWESLCEVLGHAEWAADERFGDFAARKRHEPELEEAIAAVTAERDARELMEALQAAGVRAAMVNTMRDLYSDPQLQHRRIWRKREHPEIGELHYRFGSCSFSETPGEITGAAPCLGEHNELVFKSWIGYSDEEYNDLVEQGVID